MKKFIASQIIFIVIMVVLVFVIDWRQKAPHVMVSSSRQDLSLTDNLSGPMKFLNPTVASGATRHFIIDFQPLRDSLSSKIKKYPGKVYVYFSYLNNGAWLGINERDMITAASTVKVPIAMTVYKAIEEGRLSGKESYTLTEDDLNTGFGDLYAVGSDKTLSLQDLLEIMLVHSDNTAENALMSIFNRIGMADPLDDVYADMGWVTYGFIGSAPVENYGKISLKVLSNMFLSLYNATYVSPEHSESILEYLSKTPFNDKIDAGVPDSVLVAHKIGTYEPDNTYSDCGIVYAPNRNYLLCMASVGVSEKQAAPFLAELSKTVYTYVLNN